MSAEDNALATLKHLFAATNFQASGPELALKIKEKGYDIHVAANCLSVIGFPTIVRHKEGSASTLLVTHSKKTGIEMLFALDTPSELAQVEWAMPEK